MSEVLIMKKGRGRRAGKPNNLKYRKDDFEVLKKYKY